MAFADELLDLMPQTFTMEAKSGTLSTGTGETTFSAGVSCTGLVQQGAKLIKTPDNREVVSSTQVYSNTTTAWTVEDRITLPSGYVPSQPRILRIDRLSDESGLAATVIYC